LDGKRLKGKKIGPESDICYSFSGPSRRVVNSSH